MVLEKRIENGYTPALIITAPDKPSGRKLILTPTPTKEWAIEHAIDVAQPEKLTPEFTEELGNTNWHLSIVASYGKIIPGELIQLPQHGTVNVHPSLLPRWRGAAPIQPSILNDYEPVVTIVLIDDELDHCHYIAKARIELSD